jgi:dTDP-4-amino-4,6-dideoxygalactose transaminase
MLREAGELSNRDLAFDETGAVNPWYYEMPKVGLNYRVTDIQCALGLSQIRKLDRFVARRRALAARYDDLLADLAPLVRPITKSPAGRAAWHLYAVLIDFEAAGLSRARLVERLMAVGVGTQVHYIPVHLQPYYRGRYGALNLPGAERYYARTLSLPLFPAMRDEDVERVVDALARALRQS